MKKKTQIGDWVEISTGKDKYLSDLSWKTGPTVKGQVIAHDIAGNPLIIFENLPSGIEGTWGIAPTFDYKSHNISPEFQKKIPLGKKCLFYAFDSKAVKLTTAPTEEVTTKEMPKFKDANIKLGDRLVIATDFNGHIAKYAWQENFDTYAGMVVGCTISGEPILQLDKFPLKTVQMGVINLMSPSYDQFISANLIKDRTQYKFIPLINISSYLKEEAFNFGKKPSFASLPLYNVLSYVGLNAVNSNIILDHSRFIETLRQLLPDNDCFIFGKGLATFFTKNPAEGYDIFCPEDISAEQVLISLQRHFDKLLTFKLASEEKHAKMTEYEVKFNYMTSTNSNIKVRIHNAHGLPTSPFEDGGIDIHSCQLYRDGTVKNFAQVNVIDALDNLAKKQFTTFGKVNKLAIEDLIKQGFALKGKKEMKNEMATVPSFGEMLLQDLHKAKYRVAADQITHGIKEGLVMLLKNKGADKSQLEGVAMLLDSDIGSAMIAMAAGLGLTYAPMISADPRAQKLAGEFRVNGMAKAGNVLVETMVSSFLPIVKGALDSLPAEEQVRVAEPVARLVPSENEEEDDESSTNLKKNVA